MRELGVMYGRGEGVPQSYSEEMHWYVLAANKGDDVAMLYLGYIYRRGDGVAPDSAKALDWFRKSAEKGQSNALYMVGAMYRDGEGVSQDFAEAYFWLNLSTADPPPGSQKDRDAIVAKLSPAKLTEIQDRCRKWAETHPKIHFFDVGKFPQPATSLSGATLYSNDRLKRFELKDYPIDADGGYCTVDGMWVPESKEPAKALPSPEQVKITCSISDKSCRELKVTLGPIGGLVFIAGIDETIWPITSWDSHGLLASYGPDVDALGVSDRCHRHVLTMSFASGAVSTSDLPTHEKGCETFTETDSYRLAKGEYYVDTTPGNDGGSPIKMEERHPLLRNPVGTATLNR
jgi:hypothetical protein